MTCRSYTLLPSVPVRSPCISNDIFCCFNHGVHRFKGPRTRYSKYLVNGDKRSKDPKRRFDHMLQCSLDWQMPLFRGQTLSNHQVPTSKSLLLPMISDCKCYSCYVNSHFPNDPQCYDWLYQRCGVIYIYISIYTCTYVCILECYIYIYINILVA